MEVRYTNAADLQPDEEPEGATTNDGNGSLSPQERETTLLRLIHEATDAPTLVVQAGALLREWFDCEAVAFRWQQEEDFPYIQHSGFAEDFVQAESSLCQRDARGKALCGADGCVKLECLCGAVVSGAVDAALPFFTDAGSFWTNNAPALLAKYPQARALTQMRGRCLREGFHSIALIPLRFGDTVHGLLQLDAKKPDRFTADDIAFLERVAGSFALRLAEYESRTERERLLAQVEDERQRLYSVLDMMPGYVCLISPDHEYRYVSDRFVEFFGEPAEGQKCYNLVLGRNEPCENCEAFKPLIDGQPVEYDWHSPSGRILHIWNYRFLDRDGTYLSLETGMDVTETKRAEAESKRLLSQVRAERERLFSVLSTFPAYVCLLTPEHECAFANKRFTELFGKGKPHQKCYNLIFGRSEPCEDCQSFDCLSDNVPRVWEWVDPHSRCFEVYDYPFIDMDGTRLVLEAGFEITDRKLAEEELRRHRDHLGDLVAERTARLAENEQKYRELVENAHSAIVRWDHDGIIEFVNEYAEELLEYQPDELIGQSIKTIIPGLADGESCLQDWRDAVPHNPQTFTHTENLTKSGRRLWMLWSTRVIQDDDNSESVMAVGVDRTEHHEAEVQLLRLNRVYAVLNAAAEAIIRYRDRQELFDEICRIAVEEGGFRMAWIGTVDPETSRVVPVTRCGHEQGYLREITVEAAKTPQGGGPTGRAVLEGTYQVCNDIANDPAMAPWAKQAAERGYRSSGAFPFQAGGTTGVLTIYSGEVDFFDGQRISLLQALAINLAIALEKEDAEEKLRTHQERLRALASELVNAEQRERQRVATLLHDEVAQTLASLKLHLSLLHSDSAADQDKLAPLVSLAGDAVVQTRSIMTELTPPMLQRHGLVDTLRWWANVIQQRHPLQVTVEAPAEPVQAEASLQTALFQATKELLHNVIKHADATEAVVTVAVNDDLLQVAVKDNGCGFIPKSIETTEAGGFGLFSIRERLAHLGGDAMISSMPGCGTEIMLTVPIG